MRFEKQSREIDWARELIEQSWAGRAARVVQAANGVGIFERIGRGRATADVLAADLEIDAAMTERILIACAAMGLVARDGAGWRLTPKAEATLLKDAPLYQGHTIAHASQVWPVWLDLEAHLRGQGGASVFSEGAEAPARSHRDFILAMHNMAMAGRAAELAARVDLSGAAASGHLADVGGGPGTYAMAICARYPGLRATILDLPETVEIAREVIARLGMADRVRAVPGDWDKDEFGEANDAVLMSNVLHGPTSRAEMKLAKAHRSLKRGGRLIIQDFLMNDEKTGPLQPALFNIMVGAFSRKELAERVAAAGFVNVRCEAMPEDLGTSLLLAAKP